MKILITGSNGFVGKCLKKELSKNRQNKLVLQIKNKKKNNKITKKIVLNNEKISNKSKIKKKSQIKARKKIDKNFDVCTILEKCSIDEISKYLIKIGKEKNYPDITTRQ